MFAACTAGCVCTSLKSGAFRGSWPAAAWQWMLATAHSCCCCCRLGRCLYDGGSLLRLLCWAALVGWQQSRANRDALGGGSVPHALSVRLCSCAAVLLYTLSFGQDACKTCDIRSRVAKCLLSRRIVCAAPPLGGAARRLAVGGATRSLLGNLSLCRHKQRAGLHTKKYLRSCLLRGAGPPHGRRRPSAEGVE